MSTGGKDPVFSPASAAAKDPPAVGDAAVLDQSWLVDSELVDVAYAETMANAGIQTSLPPPEPVAPPPAWLTDLFSALAAFFEWSGPVLNYLLWALGGALLLFLAYRFIPGFAAWVDARRRRPAEQPDAIIGAAEASAARARLADADALANQGRFAEAVHLLLGRSVDDIAARRPGLVQPALTARDLAGAEDLPSAVRLAFGRIARAVEITLFGGRSIDRRVWDECRAAYADLTIPASWTAA